MAGARAGPLRLFRLAPVLGLVLGAFTPRQQRTLPEQRPIVVWAYLDGSRSAAEVGNRIADRGRVRVHSRWLRALSVETTAGDTAAIAAVPGVRALRATARAQRAAVDPAERGPLASPDRAIPTPEPGDPYGNARAQLDRIGVPDAHAAGLTGRGIRIAILDTGFRRDHESLARVRLAAQRDFLQGDAETQNEPGESAEQQEHGTLCWSACGGFAPGVHMGPAHGAEFLLAKTEDPSVEFLAEEDTFVAALEWADSMGADIVSSSLVFQSFIDAPAYEYEDLDGETTAPTRALDRAAARGMLCFQGAGNAGPLPETIVAPSDADSIIACGAVDPRNRIASFSSRGPTPDGRTKPEITAPGVDVWSADAAGTRTYARFDGTSLATPLCAGAAALVWEAHPEWSAMEVREALLATADHAEHPDDVVGYGTIHAVRAIHYKPILVPGPFAALAPAGSDSVEPAAAVFRWERPRLVPERGSLSYELWIDDPSGFAERIVLEDLSDTAATLSIPLAERHAYRWMVWALSEQGFRRGSRDWLAFVTTGQPPDPDMDVSGISLRVVPCPSRDLPAISVYLPGRSSAGSRPVSFGLFDVRGRRIAGGRTLAELGRWIRLDDLVVPDGSDSRDPGAGIYWFLVSGSRELDAAAKRLVLIR